MGVSASKSDKTTPSLARSFERRSLFDAQSGCIRWRRVRGSRCARFEVHTVARREDIYNLLLLICYKGGALWDIIQQYAYCLCCYVIGDSSLLRLIWMIGFIIIEVILNLTISHGSSSG